ncbi:type II toxin-antitoxin system VapC family toxin [Candidatus Amesbacteria bacterium]|nr:type II toxin-antitoxin system VapC family toxin [Candidatus Amesbacteria bacterium]
MPKLRINSGYLLDSDISIWIIRGDEKIIKSVASLVHNQQSVISILTVGEIYKNSFPEEELSNEHFFKWHKQIPIDFQIAKLAGEYWHKFRNINNNFVDYLVAATCKLNKFTLLTRNTKHFPMKDIKIIDPPT